MIVSRMIIIARVEHDRRAIKFFARPMSCDAVR